MTASRPALGAWFFEEGDASAAAAVRVGFGLTCLFLLWDLWPVLDLLMGPAGYYGTLDPRYVDATDPGRLLFRFDSALALRVWFWGFAVAATCVTLGLVTRAAVLASLFGLILFQRRNPFMLFGADGVLAHVALWVACLRSGRAWSLDAALRAGPARRPRTIPLWPIRTLQIQMALIYFVAAVAKLGTVSWRDGSAVYYALHAMGSELIPGILEHQGLLTGMTYATVVIELAFPFLVFRSSTRWLGLGSVALLQVGIDGLMGIRFFGIVMYLGLLAFIRPDEWSALAGRIRRTIVARP